MKIKIASDLHVDLNKDGNFGFRHDKFDMLLIAGDIAGSYRKEKKFLDGLSKDITVPIYVIAGNHLGYDYSNDKLFSICFGINNNIDGTKQWSINYLKKNLPNNIHYMDNDWVDIGDYVLFGGTMYSNYELYENHDLCKSCGLNWLNDFKYVYEYFPKEKIIRPITPEDYCAWFKKFKRRLNKCIKETEKDLIIMTHFCPSIKSISNEYLKGNEKYLNASYASNLESYIKKNPRIKLWICGHVHHAHEYQIGECKVISCPYGYFGREQKVSPKKWHGKDFEIC